MRSLFLLIASLTFLANGWAQAPAPVPAEKASSAAASPVEQRTERIRVEDAGSRIDELRIGGETKTIKVQPKGGMPSYDVAPVSGERSWKVLGF